MSMAPPTPSQFSAARNRQNLGVPKMSYAAIRNLPDSHAVPGWLRSIARSLRVRYPLTVGFGTVCIVLVIIGSWQLVHRTAQGANDQLIHTLENQLSEDLIRNLDRFRSAGHPIGIDVANSDVQLELWFADISEQTGASVAVLWDLEGNVVWSNDRAHLGSDDFEGGGMRRL